MTTKFVPIKTSKPVDNSLSGKMLNPPTIILSADSISAIATKVDKPEDKSNTPVASISENFSIL